MNELVNGQPKCLINSMVKLTNNRIQGYTYEQKKTNCQTHKRSADTQTNCQTHKHTVRQTNKLADTTKNFQNTEQTAKPMNEETKYTNKQT